MSESNPKKRNLPSWMSSREEENGDGETPKQPRNHGNSNRDKIALHHKGKGEEESVSATGSAASNISRLMEGVVFALSGFVNPERGDLRSQMLEMGAEYQPDWNSNCTLLVCAFSNTPKFRQVKADGGTIISKDWISECYSQRKLVDIEPFLLHAGKPWRRQCLSHDAENDTKPSASTKSLKQEEMGSHSKKATGSSKLEEASLYSKKATSSSKMKGIFSPSKVKKWAVEDLKRTISWLENQEEKPAPSEITKIAAEGILTCMQDAIDALEKGQGVQQITEQWACLPRVVEQLAQYDGPSKDYLCREAMACKQIYELEFLNLEHDDIVNKKSPQTESKKGGNKKGKGAENDPIYDSDATIEMTDEEIDKAYNTIAASL